MEENQCSIIMKNAKCTCTIYPSHSGGVVEVMRMMSRALNFMQVRVGTCMYVHVHVHEGCTVEQQYINNSRFY